MSEAENESDKLYKEALELANNEANASKEKARLEIESQTSAARDQLSKQADDLSELIVNRLILENEFNSFSYRRFWIELQFIRN